jgi:hypothetical protein
MRSDPYAIYPFPACGFQIFRCVFSPVYRHTGKPRWLRLPVRFIATFDDQRTAKAVCADLNRSVR